MQRNSHEISVADWPGDRRRTPFQEFKTPTLVSDYRTKLFFKSKVKMDSLRYNHKLKTVKTQCAKRLSSAMDWT